MDEVGLAKAIQDARKKAGLTQQELCQKADLSYSTLAKIERGAIKTPSVFTVARIASVLGIDLGSLLGSASPAPSVAHKTYKTSRSGISFLYLDINGCLVRFFHGAFTRLAHETGASSELIETTFWHYNDAVCRGELSVAEFNTILAEKLGVPSVNWQDYYMDAVEVISETQELLTWASQHYRVGLLSNIMPGFIEDMKKRGLLPNIEYTTIVDSSAIGAIKPEQAMYEIALQKAGVPAHEILFVDDSRTNLMAAERMGWRVLWFDDYRPQESVDKIRSSLEF
jgi:putative hydrolase of the HAD superfamily